MSRFWKRLLLGLTGVGLCAGGIVVFQLPLLQFEGLALVAFGFALTCEASGGWGL